MMKRLSLQDLRTWRSSSARKPLLIRGARQVGKTHVVRQLGHEFDSFVEINFEKNPQLAKIFEHDLDPIRITRELSLAINKKIEPGNTLLFLDEVQGVPAVIIALRYFYEDLPQLHIIAAGSLIDFAIEKVGVPVGRISFLYMYPMSFIEFLKAYNYSELAIELVNHDPNDALNDAIHNKALRLLGEYMAIGGMPEAVSQWINHQDVNACTAILQNIKIAYEQDFSKYTENVDIKYIDLLFKQIPNLISQHFKYSNLATSFRKRELEPALLLLEKAGIIHQVFHTLGNGIPLGAEADFNKFKLVLLDVGLNQAILDLNLKDWYIDPTKALANKGNICENFVGQELLAYSEPNHKQNLYYWHRETRSSQAEIDYLIATGRNVIPIEVKGGHGAGLQSMRIFMQSHPSSIFGIRFSTYNYSVFDGIHSYPIYAVAGAIDNKERLLKFLEE